MPEAIRIDKYLWAIRVFKTRSEATEACKGNRVRLNGVAAKPSKLVSVGDKLEIRKAAIQYVYQVKALIGNRVGAKLVCEYAENLTPQSEIDKLRAPVETFFLKRDRGAGRPTKKDRREMDEMWDVLSLPAESDDDIPDDIAFRFGLDDSDE